MILLKSPSVCNSSIWTSHRFWLTSMSMIVITSHCQNMSYITNCFIHTYEPTTLLYESQLFAIFCTGTERERETHTHTHTCSFLAPMTHVFVVMALHCQNV
jgi:hypothetical protein